MSLNMTEFAILQVTGELCNTDVKLASGPKIFGLSWDQNFVLVLGGLVSFNITEYETRTPAAFCYQEALVADMLQTLKWDLIQQ